MTAPAGPVCILAGAGTGKTRAITHRIAYRTLTGEISPRHVLAVTFTARAAAEMRARLTALGAGRVQARTFHAAALRQVRYFAPRLLEGRAMPELVESKARLVGLAAARAGVRADRTGARDLAGEIEWAKSSLVEPGEYAVAAAKALREPPYEAGQGGRGLRGVRDAQAPPGRDRLRGHAARRGLGHRGAPRRRRADPLAVPALRRRRVPGRQPAAAAPARRLAGRPRRPDRGRRRQPDDLLVHRRHLGVPDRLPAPAPRRGRGPAGPRLPLDAAGGRPGQRGDQAGPRQRGASCGWSWSGSARPAPSPSSRSSRTSRPRRPRWPGAAAS